MAIFYNVYENANKLPGAKTPKIAVARSRQLRQISTKELAADISDRCTVHRADVQAVLEALSISATSFLLNGFGVKLGELGSLSMSLSCKSAPSLEAFVPELIKSAKVRYTPSRDILAKVKEVSFVKASSLSEVDGEPTVPGGVQPEVTPGTSPETPTPNPEGEGGNGGDGGNSNE